MEKRTKLIAWEMLLLLASVLVFRSAWLLLDRLAWASGVPGLASMLGVGAVLAVAAFRAINRSEKLP
jgi:hypothetical protein